MAKTREELEGMTKQELQDMAMKKGINNAADMDKEDLVDELMKMDMPEDMG